MNVSSVRGLVVPLRKCATRVWSTSRYTVRPIAPGAAPTGVAAERRATRTTGRTARTARARTPAAYEQRADGLAARISVFPDPEPAPTTIPGLPFLVNSAGGPVAQVAEHPALSGEDGDRNRPGPPTTDPMEPRLSVPQQVQAPRRRRAVDWAAAVPVVLVF